MARQKQYHQSDASGLEVVPDYSGLQAVPDPSLEVRTDDGAPSGGYYAPNKYSHSSGSHSTAHYKTATETATRMDGSMVSPLGYTPTPTPHENHPAPVQKKSRRRLYIIVGIVVGVAVIVGAVVGGVLGSRKGSSQSTSSNPAQNNPTSTQSGQPTATSAASPSDLKASTAVASYSRLAASGWDAEGGFTRFLFYQDYNGTLRYSMAAGSGNLDESSWNKPKTLSPQFPIKNVTSIATSILPQLYENPTVQLEIFYLNESGVVNGLNYNRRQAFGHDSINDAKKYQALEGSDLAAYWPFILYQSIEGMLQLITFPWKAYDLRVRAKHGSRLAFIPTSRNSTRVASLGRWAMLYQRDDGKLIAWEDPAGWGANKTYSGESEGTVWNSTFPDISSSDNIASIAAFSVAASDDDSQDVVNTFILYQDKSGVIQQVWRDGKDNSWHTSTPDAFKGADKEGSIACVTTPMWLNQPGLGSKLLETASALSHCFFMKDGSVMEVQLDGKDWKSPQKMAMDKF